MKKVEFKRSGRPGHASGVEEDEREDVKHEDFTQVPSRAVHCLLDRASLFLTGLYSSKKKLAKLFQAI